jgi:hypothetical protein
LPPGTPYAQRYHAPPSPPRCLPLFVRNLRPTLCTMGWCGGSNGASSSGTTPIETSLWPGWPLSRRAGPSLSMPGRSSRITPISWSAPGPTPWPAACGRCSPRRAGGLLGTVPRSWQDTEAILAQFGPTRRRAQHAYHTFVAAGLPQGRRPELQGGGLLRSQGGWAAVTTPRRGADRPGRPGPGRDRLPMADRPRAPRAAPGPRPRGSIPERLPRRRSGATRHGGVGPPPGNVLNMAGSPFLSQAEHSRRLHEEHDTPPA